MKCTEKRTKYQPADEDFVCPECGIRLPDFHIEDTCCELNGVINWDCTFLHESDLLMCENCKHELTGKQFARYLIDKKRLMQCPTCKGKGMVRKND